MSSIPAIVYTLAAIYTVIAIVSISLFSKYRNVEPLKSRNPMLSLVPALFGIIHVWCYSVFYVLKVTSDDPVYQLQLCPLYYYPLLFFPSLFYFPTGLRAYIFSIRVYINIDQAKGKFDSYAIRNRKYTETGWVAYAITGSFIMTLVINLLLQYLRSPLDNPNRCERNHIEFFLVNLGTSMMAWICYCIIVWRAKNDTYYIKYELTALLFFTIVATVCATTIYYLNETIALSRYYDTGLFYICLVPINLFFSIICPVGVMFHEKSVKPIQYQSISSKFEKKDPLLIMMDIPQLRESFMNFCVKSLCVENLFFLLEAIKFESLDPNNKELLLQEAKKIEKQYFLSTSPMSINIEEYQTNEFIEAVRSGSITCESLISVKEHVLVLIKRDPFRRWQQTEEFKSFLDLIRSKTATTSVVKSDSKGSFTIA